MIVQPGRLAIGLPLSQNDGQVLEQAIAFLQAAGVKPGDIGVDDSFSFPDGDQLQAASVDLEVRYFSTPDSNAKNWTDAQFADRHARGIATLAIHEQVATDHLGGEPAGRAKAKVFARLAEKRGYPRDVPAGVSCDSSVTAETLDYAGAFDDEIKRVEGWQLTFAYGFGPEFVQALWENRICDRYWQAYAGSAVTGNSLEQAFQRGAARWGDMVTLEQVPGLNRTVQGVHLMAHAFQCLGSGGLPSTELVTSSVDWNRIMRPMEAWLPGGTPPPPTGDNVTIMRVPMIGANALFLGDFDSLGRCRHLDWLSPEDAANWAAAPMHDPIPPEAVRNMSVDRVPQGDGAHAWAASDFRFVYAMNGGGGQGPVGPTGPTGPQGAKGDVGPAGPAGPVDTSTANELANLKAKLRAV